MELINFLGNQVSRLGFGVMRLPLMADGKTVDREESLRVLANAYKAGINYFDTAFSYHNGESELILGEAIKNMDREKIFVVSKMPGHEINPDFDPELIFNRQLEKVGVEYFDYYLLHNVCEYSLNTYLDEKYNVIDFVLRMKEEGKIRHIGISSHAQPDALADFVEKYPDVCEFVQIQLNYLDWTMQDAYKKYEFLESKNITVVVMEPLRGGKLASLFGGPQMAFDFVRSLENCKVILSGMSSEAQLEDNVRIFSRENSFTQSDFDDVLEKAKSVVSFVPCTGCGYCKKDCPMGIDIPLMMKLYNDSQYEKSMNLRMSVDALEPDRRPNACIKCGKCKMVCPQNIDIPGNMEKFSEILQGIVSWADESLRRAEQTRLLKEKMGK